MSMENNPFGDMTKMIQQFQMPGVDMAAIAASGQKDIEALVEANKAAYSAMQALARKQTEMMTEAMQRIQTAAASAASGVTAATPAEHAETVRKTIEKTLADMKELAEMARTSQADAMSHITQRANEHLHEMQRLMQPK